MEEGLITTENDKPNNSPSKSAKAAKNTTAAKDKASTPPEIMSYKEIVAQHQVDRPKSRNSKNLEKSGSADRDSSTSLTSKKLEKKNSSSKTLDPESKSSLLEKKNSAKFTDKRNSLEKEPDFLDEGLSLKPKLDPTIFYSSGRSLSGGGGTGSTNLDAADEAPIKLGTRIGSFHGESRVSADSAGAGAGLVKKTSSAEKRNTSPVRTRSPPKSESGSERPKPSRNTSPQRTRSPPKRPTTPPRNQRNSADIEEEEPQKTRWGGVQTGNIMYMHVLLGLKFCIFIYLFYLFNNSLLLCAYIFIREIACRASDG
jgi:hypothetical protein